MKKQLKMTLKGLKANQPISNSKIMNELKAVLKAKSEATWDVAKYEEKENRQESSDRLYIEYVTLNSVIRMIEDKTFFESMQYIWLDESEVE